MRYLGACPIKTRLMASAHRHRTENWLCSGGEATGQRSAIIYTLIECARRHGHNPEAYLADIFERLPAMTNQDDLGVLLPSRWQPVAAAGAALESVPVI